MTTKIAPPRKTLHNYDASGTKTNVPDVVTFGNPDMWQLLCKASSKKEGWMKITKAMDVGHGCLVQATTQQGSNVSEAITYVPGVRIVEDDEFPGGRRLSKR